MRRVNLCNRTNKSMFQGIGERPQHKQPSVMQSVHEGLKGGSAALDENCLKALIYIVGICILLINFLGYVMQE